jgi:hypothetical protein
LVLQDSLGVLDNRRVILANTFTFSSKNSLINGKAIALDSNDSAIRRNTVSHSNSDNITRNQLVGLYSGNVSTIANYVGLVGRVFLEGSNGLLSTAFLRNSDDGVKDENGENLVS